MKDFMFDCTCYASIVVRAENEDDARGMISRAIELMEVSEHTLSGFNDQIEATEGIKEKIIRASLCHQSDDAEELVCEGEPGEI